MNLATDRPGAPRLPRGQVVLQGADQAAEGATRQATHAAAAPRAACGWEHFEHQADIGVRGIGPNIEAAFEQAAMALTAVVTPPSGVAARRRVDLACDAADDEALFVAWLNALIYEMAVRRMVFGRFRVSIDGAHLRASAWGEPISVLRHAPAVEVKGATFTALRVARCEGGGWLAQTVVDV